MRIVPVVIVGLALLPAAVGAQISPDASASLGTGHGATALSGAILDGTRRLDPRGGRAATQPSPTMQRYCARWPDEGVCRANRARAAQRASGAAAPVPPPSAELQARLRPEYEARVRRDGRASADRWLREQAFALGRGAGRAARQ